MLVVEYHGARFHGWQVQPNVRTVAGVLGAAIRRVTGEDVMLVGSGRTDEGVHAQGQVANFLTRSALPCAALHPRLQAELPADVAVLRVEDVGPEFHARHSATSRVYRYEVLRRASLFRKGLAWVVTGPLHVKDMRTALTWFTGFHDFTSFCDVKLLAGADPRVEITHADWKEHREGFTFRIAGSHFLPRMVRRLVGCAVRVGTGELPLDTLRGWMETPTPGAAAPLTAPAMGLYLDHVEYAPTTGAVNPVALRAAQALERGEAATEDEDTPD